MDNMQIAKGSACLFALMDSIIRTLVSATVQQGLRIMVTGDVLKHLEHSVVSHTSSKEISVCLLVLKATSRIQRPESVNLVHPIAFLAIQANTVQCALMGLN